MVRLVLLGAVAVGLYVWLRGGRGSFERLLPYVTGGLALLYLLAPLDLIPDVGLVGLLDDVAILLAAAMWVRRQQRGAPADRTSQPRTEQRRSEPDPHAILGVPRGATAEEIARAYREKIKLYHPDRVNGLGDELQKVATEKTIEIQRAYDALRQAGA